MIGGIELILSAICINSTCINNSSSNTEITKDEYISTLSGSTSDIFLAKQEELKIISDKINGQRLKIATLQDFPLSHINRTNGILEGFGVSFTLVDFLAEKFNFTYEVVTPTQNIIGSTKDMNGSLIQMLYQKKADMAAAFIPILADTRKFVFYSTTILDEGEWVMVMRRPAESATGSGLLAPFETNVWILILISLLAVGPIIYVLIIIRNKITGDNEQKPYSLSHCAWFVYGGLMKQGSTLSPIADSTRILFATWWLFITILTSFYTANLTAFLTLSKFTLPFNSVTDILRKEKYFVASRGGGVEYAIKNDGETLNILNNMVNKNRAVFTDNLKDMDTLLTLVETNNYVFVRDHPAMDHLLYQDYRFRKTLSRTNEKIHCPFAVSKDPFLRKRRAFAYPHGSPWSVLIDHELLNLVESGIVKYLTRENLPNAIICPQNLGGTERQLRNGDLVMTYYIMLAGFATATVIFCSEILFRYLNYKRIQSAANIKIENPERNKFGFTENITPPPPYASLFNRSKNILENVNNIRPNGELNGVKKIINGRDYIVFYGIDGEKKLIPMRAPSATLFQYSYTE